LTKSKINNYDNFNNKIVVLPGALYGCETLSFTFREKYRLREWMLWRIFEPKTDEVTGGRGKLRNDSINKRMIK
jgi:hypothetical protein